MMFLGSTYTSTDRWKFVQFGDYMIAANGEDKLQYADMATTTYRLKT
jgi:hypothetical protein